MKIPTFKKLSDAQRRDLEAYLGNLPKVGTAESWALVDHTAATIEEWYWLWDTHGIRARFHDQALTWRLVQAKGQLNLTVKLWVEDIVNTDMLTLKPDEVWLYCHTLQHVNLAPDNYTFWPVAMDDFDPVI